MTSNLKQPRSAVLALAIGATCIGVLLLKAPETPFQGDESGWIAAGNYYTALLARGELNWRAWQCLDCGGEIWGSLNMQLGKLLIGIPLRVASRLRTTPPFFAFYDWEAPYEANLAAGNVPPRATLLTARCASAIVGVMSCLLLFIIGSVSRNVWVGALATTLLLFNRLFTTSATRAMPDVHYTFFLLGCALATWYLLRAMRGRQATLASVSCGALSGLACSIKITGLVIGSCLFAAVILYKWAIGKISMKGTAAALLAFALAALVLIYVLNPFFWPSAREVQLLPLLRETAALARRPGREAGQADRPWQPHPQLTNLARPLAFPRLFIRWHDVMGRATADAPAAWRERRFLALHESLFVKYSTFPFEWLGLTIGLVACGTAVYRAAVRKDVSPASIPLLYFLVNYLFILRFIAVDWGRYYLPTVVAGKLLAAYGCYEVARAVASVRIGRLLKKARPRQPADRPCPPPA